MKLATTTEDFGIFLETHIERIDAVIEAGFKYIDLSLYTISENDELLVSDKWQDNAKRILEHTVNQGATFVQAHSPGGNPVSGDDSAEKLIEATIRSIDVCGALNIPNIVVHAGTLPGMNKEGFFKENKKFFDKLIPAMEKNSVNVLCENSTAYNMPDRYFTNSGKDMKEFIEYVNHPLFHGCWDTGHGNCEGNQYDDIIALGEHLYALHINDNRGCGDEHVLPYFGTVNMDEVMNALIDVNYKGVFTFESCTSLRPYTYWQGDRRKFEKDTRLREPKLFMMKHLEKLMYDMGEYFLKAYNCFDE